MISVLLIIIFVLGYSAIALEHSLKLNKAASALLTGVICWTIYIFSGHPHEEVVSELLVHFGNISSILFFLLGAMTIVELIDSHNGFEIITSRITTTSKTRLLFIISLLTFFLSALLDNLTTSIIMTSLSAKLLRSKEDRLWFASMIIIAANAGGAWSPMGDVTTTMLWIGGQITAVNIILKTFLPSLMVLLIPLFITSFRFRGKHIDKTEAKPLLHEADREGKIVLFCGVGFLVFVPVFKTITHLPPFMGMLFGLSMMWIITTVLHSAKDDAKKKKYSVSDALMKIDTPSVLFFLGILMAVTALESFGLLKQVADTLDSSLKDNYLIGSSLGMLSAIVDNVPLVAATQGMYDMTQYPTDHYFWEFIALTTGTGGSIIIIGSAAGVAVMGIEKIRFDWYLKKIGWIAAAGFAAGILFYILQQKIFFE